MYLSTNIASADTHCQLKASQFICDGISETEAQSFRYKSSKIDTGY